ncbi:MAG TPA: hypothetical protein VJ936_08235 [Desulfobacteraceae bacterium]|nr:hypothetical protein [Desulfobacteraceae bacterium]
MGRFEEFELPVRKIQDYPLVYEAIIPGDCIFFQDIKRYQSASADLDVRIIDINGAIHLDQDRYQVPMSKLTTSEKKAFIDYLKIRVTRGDNIGSSWTFFRSQDKKKPIAAYGANIVYRDSARGLARAKTLLNELSRGIGRFTSVLRFMSALAVAAVIAVVGYQGYQLLGSSTVTKTASLHQGREMAFYRSVFPVLHDWLTSDEPMENEIAKAFLQPEFVAGTMDQMSGNAYGNEDGEGIGDRGTRLALFVYFNYNQLIPDLIQQYRYRVQKTELLRLYEVYSCRDSNYTSDIFYFKVGELDIKNAQVPRYLRSNHVPYGDYERIRGEGPFSDIIDRDAISFKLKGFLEDVYTFTPLRITKSAKGVDWYLLARTGPDASLDFAAFFQAGQSTLVPKRVGRSLLNGDATAGSYTWYTVTPEQARDLKLSDDSRVYFTEKTGQVFKLDVLARKIESLELETMEKGVQVAIQRELLTEDSKGKYGIQCYDPITALVLANLISDTSFQAENNVKLKRDPIQINTSLVQLSKDDSHSTQSINITPGQTGILELFRDRERFAATLKNGRTVTFEKASLNLFTPFSFMVYPDSITFSHRHSIEGMTFRLDNRKLKIAGSGDGGHELLFLE